MGYDPPVLSYDDVREYAEEFLSEFHEDQSIPTPIEEIVEFDYGIEVIPIAGLRDEIGVDAFLSSDLQEISEDIGDQYRFFEFQANTFAGLVLVPPVSPKARFTRRLEEAKAKGLEHSEILRFPLRQRLVDGLAREFEVSEQTMTIRLEKDGLLPPLIDR